MSNYGYDSVRKTVQELSSLPTPRSAMTASLLRDAEQRLKEARREILSEIPEDELDAFIEEYRNRNGLRRAGTICENGKPLLESLRTKREQVEKPAKREKRKTAMNEYFSTLKRDMLGDE